MGELFGKTLAFGAAGVKVAFCSLGTDAQCVVGLYKGGDAGMPWADGDGMTRLPPQPPDNLDQAAVSILEPEAPAGGSGL